MAKWSAAKRVDDVVDLGAWSLGEYKVGRLTKPRQQALSDIREKLESLELPDDESDVTEEQSDAVVELLAEQIEASLEASDGVKAGIVQAWNEGVAAFPEITGLAEFIQESFTARSAPGNG